MPSSRFQAGRRWACLALIVPLLAGLPSQAAGVSLLRDIQSAQDSRHDLTPSDCCELVALGNTVYFTSESPSAGTELWKSDGTSTGTVRLFSAPVGESYGELVFDWARVGNTLFFSAGLTGNVELWKTDGTPAGTARVKDIAPDDGVGSFPRHLTALGSTLYFDASDYAGSSPWALWKSDGTEAGTVKVWSPPSSGSVDRVDEVGGSLLMQVGATSSSPTSLWKSDGTAAGTVKVVDLPQVAWASVTLGGRLVLWMSDEVWVSDGTAGGTRLLRAVSRPSWSPPVVVGSQAFFLGSDPSHGLELWTTDGTESGTRLVKDLLPGGDGALGGMATLGGTLYFMGTDTQGSIQLWKTDGTEAGTVKVAALAKPVELPFYSKYMMASAAGRLFFTFGKGLWVSDGTAAGTARLVPSRPEPLGSNPGRMTRLGGLALFTASDDEHGLALWRTDGTEAGTTRVKDLREDSTLLFTDPRQPWVVREGAAFFTTADVSVDGRFRLSLWRTDGTGAGTSRVKTFEDPFGENWPLMLVGDTLLLAGKDPEHGVELWRSDGTTEGTVLVKDLAPGISDSRFGPWAALGNRLFFWADDGTHGLELWTSDGTEAGTVLFKEFAPGSAGGLADSELRKPLMAVIDGTLYFGARDTEHGLELWKTDGTTEGTVLVKDVNPGPYGSLSSMTVAGGRLLLSLNDGTHGVEPWVSDGTGAGTVLLSDVWPGEHSGSPLGFTRVGDTVLFLARDPVHGAELWKTDGTPAGTVLLSDVWPGPDSALRYDLVDTRDVALWGVEELGLAFFQGADASSGEELWVTDGTAAGTRRVVDLVPGEGSSTPTNLVLLGEKLVFAATDPLVGNEPRVLPWARQPDTSAPVLTCPDSISTTAPDANGVAVAYAPATATDDRDTPVIEYGQASGSTFPVGTTAVTVTATDTAGNRSQCTFEVTVTKAESGEPAAEGCACTSSGPGASVFWGLLALLAVARVPRRESPLRG